MIAGNIQIASTAAPNTTGASATGKSLVPAADFQLVFHQHMRNELGKLVGAPAPKESITGKPAKKQVATSPAAATAVPDEAAAPPRHRSLPSFTTPLGTSAANISLTAAQPAPCPVLGSELCRVDESAGQVDSAIHEKPQAPAEPPDSSFSSAASVAFANPADSIPRPQPEPPKAAPGKQSCSSAEAIPSAIEKAGQDAVPSLPPDDRGSKAELDDETTVEVAAQLSDALPPPQLSAAVEPVLPPVAAQSPQAKPEGFAKSDASAQVVDGVSSVKPAPSNKNLSARKDAAEGHDNASDTRAKATSAVPERRAAETGNSRVTDTAQTPQPREASDAVSNSSFTQALAAERAKPPATEAGAQEPAQSASTATPDHAPVAGDETNALHLQSARLMGNDTQAEMQVGLHTADYGHVEIKTTLQNSAVGATIAVEHTALREQIVSALPELRHSFTERQITLDSLTVNDSLSATTSFTNSHQQRSNQQPAAVPYQGSQERPAEPDWETKSGASSGPVLQPWGGDSGSELNVLV
jgi:flagellar hook-length control protein FliK